MPRVRKSIAFLLYRNCWKRERRSAIQVRAVGNNCGILAATFGGGRVLIEHATVATQSGSGLCLDGADSVEQITLVNSITETQTGSEDLLIDTTAPTLVLHNVLGTIPPNMLPDALANACGWQVLAPHALSVALSRSESSGHRSR